MRRMILAAVLFVAATSPTYAGNAGPESGAAAAARQAGDDAAKDKIVGDAMTDTLRKAGFTDLQVMPNSVLVRGKDKAGNPVAMVFNPKTMTEVVTLDPHSGPAAGGNGAAAPLTGASPFVTVLPSARLASTLMGLAVHGADDKTIATIKDLAIDHEGIQAYVLAVGGVLGIGDRYVAVAPAALSLAYDPAANSWRATLHGDATQLSTAPAFEYEGVFKAKRD